MTNAPIPLSTVSDDEIFEHLRQIVAASLRIDPARVTPATSLDALGAESIDVVEITMDVEHAFTVLMPERSILQLADDVAGDGVFERDGVLTSQGAALLRARMPDIDPVQFSEGVAVASLTPVFLRIDVWMRLVRGLLNATLRTCPHCGDRLVQGTPGRVRCLACPRDVDMPSGDEIGLAWVREWIAASR